MHLDGKWGKAVMQKKVGLDWTPYIQRYKSGEWRAPVFRDMVLHDARSLAKEGNGLSILDIGCGGGFDGDLKLQNSIAQVAAKYIGIEPDPDITLSDIFSSVHRCLFEDAPIEPGSIDLAFSVMVLEHIENPQIFWNKVHEILRPGGIFWGFTVDSRHWFGSASLITEKLHIKDLYLNLLHGKRGEQRYENYKVFYRTNTPNQVEELTRQFSSRTVLNFYREGQIDFYIPKMLRWMNRAFDRYAIRKGWPGNIMVVRMEK
jgi:SAM-dependent methyltransferase